MGVDEEDEEGRKNLRTSFRLWLLIASCESFSSFNALPLPFLPYLPSTNPPATQASCAKSFLSTLARPVRETCKDTKRENERKKMSEKQNASEDDARTSSSPLFLSAIPLRASASPSWDSLASSLTLTPDASYGSREGVENESDERPEGRGRATRKERKSQRCYFRRCSSVEPKSRAPWARRLNASAPFSAASHPANALPLRAEL